jgi:fructuronate reductase
MMPSSEESMSFDTPLLSTSTLTTARATTRQPLYDRGRLRTGIVHLGLGAFVRAHLALYTEHLLVTEPGDWGMVDVSLQRPDKRDRLLPQSGLDTTLQRDPSGVSARIVGCLRSVLVAPEAPFAVVEAIAAPSTRIVSLTVTENGYRGARGAAAELNSHAGA